jgi:hypothetical protein
MCYDDLIFNFPSVGSDYGESVWAGIAKHVVERLGETVGHGFRMVERENESYDDGFCIEIRSQRNGTKPWDFAIRGIVGGQVTAGAVHVRAWLFLYFNNVRLSPIGNGDVFIMRYIRKERSQASWEVEGWSYGEPGEWDAFSKFENE